MFHVILAILALALIALDQFTKYLATIHLAPVREIVIIDGVLSLFYHTNAGMAFGLFQGGRWFFVIFTVLILAVLGYNYITLPKDRIHNFIRAMLAVLVAGAVGNFIDRVRQGYVVDFIFFRLINFPIFNVADILIVCSVIGMLIASVFVMRDEAKENKDA